MEKDKLSANEKAGITRDLFERYREGETSRGENEVIESLEPMFIPEKEFEVTDSLIDELEAETADFIFQKIDGRKRRGLLPLLVGSVASIALLTVIVWVLYSPYRGGGKVAEKQHVATDAIKEVILSDGSEVVLNVGTTLREGSREVWLEEGEAFFNIKPDAKRPFAVYLRNGLTVNVVGTSFTIQSYSQLPFQEVSVVSGKVNVSTQANQTVQLVADQQATYSEAEKKLSTASVNGRQKAAWRTGAVLLKNASAEELTLRIRQLYDKNIVFEGYSDAIAINIAFDKTMPVTEVAAEIATLYNFSYRVEEDKIVFRPKNDGGLP